MARGRGGYGGGDVVIETRTSSAQRMGKYADMDHDDMLQSSKKQDRALMDDITSRLGSNNPKATRYVPTPYYTTTRVSGVPELPMAALTTVARDLPRRFTPHHPITIMSYKPVPKPAPVIEPIVTIPQRHHIHVAAQTIASPSPRYSVASPPPRYYPRHVQARTYVHRPYSYDDLDIINLKRGRRGGYYGYHRPYSYDDLDLLNYRRHYRRPYFYHDLDLGDTYRQHYSHRGLYSPLSPTLDEIGLYTSHQYRPVNVDEYGVKTGSPLYHPAYGYYDLLYPSHIYRGYPKSPPPYEYWDRAVSEPPRRGKSLGGSTDLAVRNARRSLHRVERELGMDYPDIDPDYEPVRVRPRAALSTVAGTSARYVRPSAAARHVPHLPSPKSRYREIEARVESMVEPNYPKPESITTLRSRANDARSKMDHHKILLDRYLPVPMGPVSAVEYDVEEKYGELADRMPVLDKYRRSTAYTGPIGYVPPYKPAPRARAKSVDYTPSTTRKSRKKLASARPPLSETRRRAREVLCKTKGDPNYYRY